MNIPYSYEIVNVDPAAKAMEIVYSSPGRQTMHIGARMPFVGESLEAIVEMYAPIGNWVADETPVIEVTAGLTGSYAPPEPEPVTLESVKRNKLDEIANWRYLRETAGVVLNGARIRTDRSSQATISGALASLQNGLVTSIDWKAANNQWITLGLPEMTAIAQAVATHVQTSFTLEKQYADQVAAATTIEEVQAIVPETVFQV